jgi:DNA-binding NarL/FixJ family response regulator
MNANWSPRWRTSSPIRLVCIGRWDACGAAFGGGPIEFKGAHRTGTEAIERAGWGDVDVAVIDDSLPDLDTIACLQRLGQLAPHVRLIVACEAPEQSPAILWLMAGAAGCVGKSTPAAEVARACLQACEFGLCLPPGLFHEVINTVDRLRFVSGFGAELSPREMDTLVGVLLGQANKGIAARLGVGLSTVKKHVHELLRKHGVATRSELVARCAGAFAARNDGSPVQRYPGTGDFDI